MVSLFLVALHGKPIGYLKDLKPNLHALPAVKIKNKKMLMAHINIFMIVMTQVRLVDLR